jgi:hypothetical protein
MKDAVTIQRSANANGLYEMGYQTAEDAEFQMTATQHKP